MSRNKWIAAAIVGAILLWWLFRKKAPVAQTGINGPITGAVLDPANSPELSALFDAANPGTPGVNAPGGTIS